MRPTAVDGDATERIERRAPAGVWQDPKTWVSILGVLLTIMITVSSFAWNQLTMLNANVQALNNSMIETRTKQAEQIKTLEEKQRATDQKLDTFINNQNAYNYDQGKMLTRIQTQINMEKK